MPLEADGWDDATRGLVGAMVDAGWYAARYPDVAASGLDPVHHFLRFGATAERDPNRFFDSVWYMQRNADVAASGLHPILHYVRAGAVEARDPHPRFDAHYYIEAYPDAAGNPLLYHLQTGVVRGYLTERPIDIGDYLPTAATTIDPGHQAFVDVIIPVGGDFGTTEHCIRSVLEDRRLPLARVIVVDDAVREGPVLRWLLRQARDGLIHLIRNKRRLGFAACVNLGIEAAEDHDVVMLHGDVVVPNGWLLRLAAHAAAHGDTATVSPFADDGPTVLRGFGQKPDVVDDVCGRVNLGRSVPVDVGVDCCLYISRRALQSVGDFAGGISAVADFRRRALAAGWTHRLACDLFIWRRDIGGVGRVTERERSSQGDCDDVSESAERAGDPFRFAVGAAIFRQSGQPVILMISHGLGGGVGRHIRGLVSRYRDRAHVLLLQGTDRGVMLSVAGEPDHPVLTLPSHRITDLVLVLRSANVSRVHIHHQLQIDMDLRRLIAKLGVPFDVTVHDYHAVCPRVNFLRSPKGLYCGEPDVAGCNGCLADRGAHGATDIVYWRRQRAWQFLDADRVICPSDDVRQRLMRYGIRGRFVVAGHEAAVSGDWAISSRRRVKGPLRVALLGVLANHKGARIVASVVEAAPVGTIAVHLIGYWEDDFPAPAAALINATGAYREEDFDALVRRIKPDVFWFPSSAPETYSYTLSVAIASGLPIVATRLGAFAERLMGRPATWLVDHRATAGHYLEVFGAVRTYLEDNRSEPPVQRPGDGGDFYATEYLVSPGTLMAGGRAVGATGRKRIVIVPERLPNGMPTPSAYVRLILPLDHPAIGGDFDVVMADHETVFDCPGDIIATHRLAIPDIHVAERLAAHVGRIGARLLFDLDEDLTSVAPVLLRRMLRMADAVWVPEQGLVKRVGRAGREVVVVETRLDERIWGMASVAEGTWDAPVRILCMVTAAQERDFAMIEPVLRDLKAEYGERVVIDVLGLPAQRDLPAGVNRIGPSPHGARSYPAFVDWIRSVWPCWHIGLAPLVEDRFSRNESSRVVLEYAALGLAVLASDVPAYRGSIADGPGGRLVANDRDAWHAALDWLIRDQSLRRRYGQEGQEALRLRGTLVGRAADVKAQLNRVKV